jgi:hypothetical protein
MNSRAPGIENPCVGGSIPPQATKVYLAKKPTHAVGFFVSGYKQSSCPVHFRAAAFPGKLPPLLPLPMIFPAGRVCQSMFLTDTAGTLTLIKCVRRAGVPAVPEGTIKMPHRDSWIIFNKQQKSGLILAHIGSLPDDSLASRSMHGRCSPAVHWEAAKPARTVRLAGQIPVSRSMHGRCSPAVHWQAEKPARTVRLAGQSLVSRSMHGRCSPVVHWQATKLVRTVRPAGRSLVSRSMHDRCSPAVHWEATRPVHTVYPAGHSLVSRSMHDRYSPAVHWEATKLVRTVRPAGHSLVSRSMHDRCSPAAHWEATKLVRTVLLAGHSPASKSMHGRCSPAVHLQASHHLVNACWSTLQAGLLVEKEIAASQVTLEVWLLYQNRLGHYSVERLLGREESCLWMTFRHMN